MTVTPPDAKTEERYLKLLMDPLDLCAKYKPKFGAVDKQGVTGRQWKPLPGRASCGRKTRCSRAALGIR